MCWQDPAIATSRRVGNASYEAYERGTAKNAWVFESDGKTPLQGEVGHRRRPRLGWMSQAKGKSCLQCGNDRCDLVFSPLPVTVETLS